MELLLELPMHGGHAMGGAFFGLFFFRALLFGLLVFVVIKLFTRGRVGPVGFAPRHPHGPGGQHGWSARRPAEDAAFETLRMRLANGDITTDEYLERTSVLRTPEPPNAPKEKP